MAHFAEIKDGIVQRVIVVHDNELLVDGVEVESKGAEFCTNLFGGTWVQCSYSNKIRKQLPSIYYTYDKIADVFIKPKPFPSWILNETFDWVSPLEQPKITSDVVDPRYYWDEDTKNWILIV